jgi:hypothetical protein
MRARSPCRAASSCASPLMAAVRTCGSTGRSSQAGKARPTAGAHGQVCRFTPRPRPTRAAALARAARAAELVTPDSGLSAWSFPLTRQAVFAQSVATHLGDADAMLQAAAGADAAWSAGAPKVSANWAQIRVGAGIAHLLNGSLDGAVAEVEPVPTLSPGMRVATVTAYTERLRRRLEHPRYNGAAGVRELGERLAQFKADALPHTESQED